MRIPVSGVAPGDERDSAARKFIRTWLRDHLKQVDGLRITTGFSPVNPGEIAWFPTNAPPIQVLGMIEVRLDVVREGDVDKWKRERERKHKAEKKKFVQELTVKSSDS